MLRNLPRLLAAGAAVAALAPAAAQAESISYLKDGDVWLAAVDGSNATRLTTGGGHVSPSQADDGTIAVGKGDKILLLDRAGTVRTTLDPPGVPDRRGVMLDGPVADVAISPDGSRVAYAFRAPIDGVECFSYDRCIAGGVLATSGAGGVTDTYQREEPSWMTGSRLLLFGPTEHKVNYLDLGLPEVHWYEDWDVRPGYGAGLTDGEVSRQGDQIAVLRGAVTASRNVDIQRIDGDARTGTPGYPTLHCESSDDAQVNSPTFSTDGTMLAWGDSQGILVVTGLTPTIDCAKTGSYRIAPGASEPDFAPAPPPGARTPPPPPAQPPAAPVVDQPAAPSAQRVTLVGRPRVKGGKVQVRVTLARAAGYRAVLRLRGKTIARKNGLGPTLTVKLPRKHVRAVRKLGRASKALTLAITADGVTATAVVAPR